MLCEVGWILEAVAGGARFPVQASMDGPPSLEVVAIRSKLRNQEVNL